MHTIGLRLFTSMDEIDIGSSGRISGARNRLVPSVSIEGDASRFLLVIPVLFETIYTYRPLIDNTELNYYVLLNSVG